MGGAKIPTAVTSNGMSNLLCIDRDYPSVQICETDDYWLFASKQDPWRVGDTLEPLLLDLRTRSQLTT